MCLKKKKKKPRLTLWFIPSSSSVYYFSRMQFKIIFSELGLIKKNRFSSQGCSSTEDCIWSTFWQNFLQTTRLRYEGRICTYSDNATNRSIITRLAAIKFELNCCSARVPSSVCWTNFIRQNKMEKKKNRNQKVPPGFGAESPPWHVTAEEALRSEVVPSLFGVKATSDGLKNRSTGHGLENCLLWHWDTKQFSWWLPRIQTSSSCQTPTVTAS